MNGSGGGVGGTGGGGGGGRKGRGGGGSGRNRGGGSGGGGGTGGGGGGAKGDSGEIYSGRFVWRIDNFTRLKDLLKKRKITGLCVKSRRFQVGGRDCRLIVYPRGQSQPPNHLSMFLEVTDPRCAAAGTDWSCFVSHRLAVLNQRSEHAERSVAKVTEQIQSHGERLRMARVCHPDDAVRSGRRV